MSYNDSMWAVKTTREFDEWFVSLDEDGQVEVIAKVNLLKVLGPQLARPHADTLIMAPKHANMKELRGRTPGGIGSCVSHLPSIHSGKPCS